MNEIKCPYDLNQFLLGDPIFENTFQKEECEQRKFYGDCSHCFATAIASRDCKLSTDSSTTNIGSSTDDMCKQREEDEDERD